MKNALLRYYSGTGIYKNIGDYIQSLAARQFVGDDAILIERENLHNYSGEAVNLIMNGWWMHRPENWPPSSKINPFFISFHINPKKANIMLSDKGIDYLRRFQPIGCRDKGTTLLLESKGISAYFSGCLTMTLGNNYYDPNIKRQGVYFVDPYCPLKGKSLDSMKCILLAALIFLKNSFNFKLIISLSRRMFDHVGPKKILRAADFYNSYKKVFNEDILRDAVFIKHDVLESDFKSEKEKFDFAENLIKKYALAKIVVTSRIHAALPSLSLGASVIFVNSNLYQNQSVNPMSPGRFEGLLDYLNVMECQGRRLVPLGDFYKEKISNNNIPENKKDHEIIAFDLKSRCEKYFYENCFK